METTYKNQGVGGLKLIVVGFFLAMLVLMATLLPNVPIVNGRHAEERHGLSAVERIRNCPLPPEKTLVNNEERIACIYKIGEKEYGVRIVQFDKVEKVYKEITTIPKEKMHTLEQVIKWLKNTGYFE